jgi:hypothetical protein
MLNAVLMTLLQHIVSSLLGSGLFQEIERLVQLELSTDKSGPEKAAAVKASLTAAKGDLESVVHSTSGWALNLGIETAVAVLNQKIGVPAVVPPAK